MSILNPDETRALRSVTVSKAHAWQQPDMHEVGKNIFDALRAPRRKREAFQRLIADQWYSPAEVADILSVSYNTALRLMTRTGRTANFAKPRAKKRLLRVKGADLREYLKGKLE